MTEKKYRCSCCGNYALESMMDEICPVCFWQEDFVCRLCEDIAIGPNKVSLLEARRNFLMHGVSSLQFLQDVRPPYPEELPENQPPAHIPCPVCGQYVFTREDDHSSCAVCGWVNDAFQVYAKDRALPANGISLIEARMRWSQT